MNTDGPRRPFYFMVPFWGQRYREYFVDLCLPSLLAPRNLPLLHAEEGHRFLIATTADDWRAIDRLPIMAQLRRHVPPLWLEIGEPGKEPAASNATAEQYQETLSRQSACQRMLVEAAYRDRAYGCMISPDVIFSDGMVASMLISADAGDHLLLCPALRQEEEGVLAELSARGFLRPGQRLSLSGQALAIPGRVVGDLAARFLHPEMAVFEERYPGMPSPLPFRYWRMPDARGLILHTFFGLPVLMDFGVLGPDHTACLAQGTFEADYYSRNFSACGGIRVVQDADEFSMLSLTPRAVNWASATASDPPGHPNWRWRFDRLRNMRQSMEVFAREKRDTVRRDLFILPIRWHSHDLDETWFTEERRIDRWIRRAVGDYYAISKPPHTERFPPRLSRDLRYLVFDLGFLPNLVSRRANNLLQALSRIGRYFFMAYRGDAAARRWILWRFRRAAAELRGRPFNEPRPNVREYRSQ